MLDGQAPGWLAMWAATLEQRGCIESGEGFRLATRVAHAIPLALNREQRLLTHDARASGFTDLPPGYRLRVVSPVFREGARSESTTVGKETVEPAAGGLTISLQSAPDLLGYEMAWYAVAPRPEGGSRIVPLYADLHQEGEVTRHATPRVSHLAFDPAMAYFRMLFMSRRTAANDHDTFLLAARTQSLLDERTRAVEADAGSCEPGAEEGAQAPPEVAASNPTNSESTLPRPDLLAQTECGVAPRQVAAVAFLPVRVKGEEVFVNPGATLAQALQEAGADSERVLAKLDVRKPYNGRLARVEAMDDKRDLLALPLSGGEVVVW